MRGASVTVQSDQRQRSRGGGSPRVCKGKFFAEGDEWRGRGRGERRRRREGAGEGAGIGGKPGGRGQGGPQRDGGRDGGGGWRGVTAQEGGGGRLEGCRVRALLLSESLPLFTPLDSLIQFKLKKKKTYLNNNPGRKKIFSSDLNK